jgi:hypothetical protein
MIQVIKDVVERIEVVREETERAGREEAELEMLERAKVRKEIWNEVQ